VHPRDRDEIPIAIHNIWSWTHDQAVTAQVRHGRAFLVGDSAHHFPPHGGEASDNSGVQMQNIAWKLVRETAAGTPVIELLETYEAERPSVCEFNGRAVHA